MTESWSWLANRHSLRSGDQACNLNNTVSLRSSPLPSPCPECVFLLQQAGVNGEKPVTATFTGNPTTSTAAMPASGNGKNGSLSTGAKAGIALGALVIVGAVLAGILVILRRRKNQLKRKGLVEAGPGTPSSAVYYKYNIAEAPGSTPEKRYSHRTPELPSSWMPPLVSNDRDPVELAAAGDTTDHASQHPAELQTGTTTGTPQPEKGDIKRVG